MPVQAFAGTFSCNSTFSVAIGDGIPVLVGDTVNESVTIGAGVIDGGSYLDIAELVYGTDCAPGNITSNCNSPGNDVQFKGITTSNYIDENGHDVKNACIAVTPGAGELLLLSATDGDDLGLY